MRLNSLVVHLAVGFSAACVVVGGWASAAPNSPAPNSADPRPGAVRAELNQWRLIDSQSGPVNYYSILREAEHSFIHAAYKPPNKKAVLGFEVPASGKSRLHHLEWSWRPVVLPDHGDECTPEKGDSAAVVYVTWRRFLRWYSLKYVWSTTRPPGTICDRRRNAFMAQDTIVLASGGPLGVWKHEAIDLAHEFQAHFSDKDLPPLIGIAVMTDGDQTRSASTGDYADFVLTP